KAGTFKAGLIEGSTTRLYLDSVGGDVMLPRAWRRGGGVRPPVVLIASGIGITPYRAMIRASLAAHTDLTGLSVVHVIGAAERAVYTDDLDAARAAGARVEVIESGVTPVVSGDTVTVATVLDALTIAAGTRYYVSGAPDFVRQAAAEVRRIDPGTRGRFWRIRTDVFRGY
ncbi:MAG: oxidoreductase, partial [Gordonia sp. (in: high G+C Gram-positive bacteria)]